MHEWPVLRYPIGVTKIPNRNAEHLPYPDQTAHQCILKGHNRVSMSLANCNQFLLFITITITPTFRLKADMETVPLSPAGIS
jgi:hypothetical protein